MGTLHKVLRAHDHQNLKSLIGEGLGDCLTLLYTRAQGPKGSIHLEWLEKTSWSSTLHLIDIHLRSIGICIK